MENIKSLNDDFPHFPPTSLHTTSLTQCFAVLTPDGDTHMCLFFSHLLSHLSPSHLAQLALFLSPRQMCKKSLTQLTQFFSGVNKRLFREKFQHFPTDKSDNFCPRSALHFPFSFCPTQSPQLQNPQKRQKSQNVNLPNILIHPSISPLPPQLLQKTGV